MSALDHGQRVEELTAKIPGASRFPRERSERLEDRSVAGDAAVSGLDPPECEKEATLYVEFSLNLA